MDDAIFHNSSIHKPLQFKEVILEIVNYVKRDKNANYKIFAGTDSAAAKYTQFITAITVLKTGNGGRYFWTKSELTFCPTLQDRIYKETMKSITIAQELKSRLKEFIDEDFFWDEKIIVHIDVGHNGPTKNLIDAVVGMVKGYGLEAAIKPESFCSFVIADKHSHPVLLKA